MKEWSLPRLVVRAYPEGSPRVQAVTRQTKDGAMAA
jgi:hypothetical protein